MKLCDLTLRTPEENLAGDEVLLDLCEAGQCDELLRLWNLSRYFVVLGYANRAATEANLDFCRRFTVPVLRRCTGGGAILQGPGVLNYSLILRIADHEHLHSITSTNRFILERLRDTLASLLLAPVEWQGQTDLAIGGLKFSGNSQRRHRRCVLFHGSFLLNLDLDLVEKTLPMPSRQPGYRANRSHSDFLMNVSLPVHTLKAALAKAWHADAFLTPLPLDEISLLAERKYALDEWNLKF